MVIKTRGESHWIVERYTESPLMLIAESKRGLLAPTDHSTIKTNKKDQEMGPDESRRFQGYDLNIPSENSSTRLCWLMSQVENQIVPPLSALSGL